MISSHYSNSGRNLPWLERFRTSWCRVRPYQKGCVEGDRAAAVWCKTIIFHNRHIAAVTVAVSQLSRAYGGSKSLKWVAIRWVAMSSTVVQQRMRHFELCILSSHTMYVERVGMRKLIRITHGFYHACRVLIMQGREGEEEGWWYGLDMVATSSKVYTHLALALDTT
ncbi:hypothetical protein Tco_0321598 [Tanacetum coccineum]